MANKKKVEYPGLPAEHREVNDIWLRSVMDFLSDGGIWKWPAKGHSYTYSLVLNKLIPHTMQGYIDLRNILTYAGGEALVEKYTNGDEIEVENSSSDTKKETEPGFTIFYNKDKETVMRAMFMFCAEQMEFLAHLVQKDLDELKKVEDSKPNSMNTFLSLTREFSEKGHEAGFCKDPTCKYKKENK